MDYLKIWLSLTAIETPTNPRRNALKIELEKMFIDSKMESLMIGSTLGKSLMQYKQQTQNRKMIMNINFQAVQAYDVVMDVPEIRMPGVPENNLYNQIKEKVYRWSQGIPGTVLNNIPIVGQEHLGGAPLYIELPNGNIYIIAKNIENKLMIAPYCRADCKAIEPHIMERFQIRG